MGVSGFIGVVGACMAGCVCGRGMHGQGGMRGQGSMHGRRACMVGETATAADGTHPGGMYSCLATVLSPNCHSAISPTLSKSDKWPYGRSDSNSNADGT